MATEIATFIDGLDPNRPANSETLGEADDHLKLIKDCLQNSLKGADTDKWDTALLVGPRFLNTLSADLDLAAYVTIEGAQNVNGAKTFTTPIVAAVGNAAGRTFVSGSSDPLIGDQSGQTVLQSSEANNLVHRTPSGDQIVVSSFNISLWMAAAFPVGAIYINADGRNPASVFAFTTWTLVSKGRFLVGVGTGNDGVETRPYGRGNDPSGRYRHTLTEAQMPPHTHDLSLRAEAEGILDVGDLDAYWFNPIGANPINLGYTNATGGGQPHENSPPAFGVYIWQRTA